MWGGVCQCIKGVYTTWVCLTQNIIYIDVIYDTKFVAETCQEIYNWCYYFLDQFSANVTTFKFICQNAFGCAWIFFFSSVIWKIFRKQWLLLWSSTVLWYFLTGNECKSLIELLFAIKQKTQLTKKILFQKWIFFDVSLTTMLRCNGLDSINHPCFSWRAPTQQVQDNLTHCQPWTYCKAGKLLL